MPTLNVLPAKPVPGDPVRLFHRAQLQLARAIATEAELAVGTWLHNADLQPLAAANAVLDAALPPGVDAASAVADADAAAGNCPIQSWTVNPSLPAERTAPLAAHLARSGWTAVTADVLRLSRLTPAANAPTDLTILPVRSAYGPFRRLMADRFATAVEADAAELQLDDPHLDAWLALRAGAAVATVALLTDGEVGTVSDLYVAPPRPRPGVGRRDAPPRHRRRRPGGPPHDPRRRRRRAVRVRRLHARRPVDAVRATHPR